MFYTLNLLDTTTPIDILMKTLFSTLRNYIPRVKVKESADFFTSHWNF